MNKLIVALLLIFVAFGIQTVYAADSTYYMPGFLQWGTDINSRGLNIWNGTQNYAEYRWLVYNDSGTFKAIDGENGNITYSGTDASTVIQNAIDDMTNGDIIHFKVGDYTIESTIYVTSSTDWIIFEGSGYQTVFTHNQSNANMIEINTTSQVILRHFSVTNLSAQTGGYAISIFNSYNTKLENIRLDGNYNGYFINGSTETLIINNIFREMNGVIGINYTGSPSYVSYSLSIIKLSADNPTNGNVLMDWIVWDSYANTLSLNDVKLIRGRIGLHVMDTQTSGDALHQFLFANDLETDNTSLSGISWDAGLNGLITNSWFGSSQNAHGLYFAGNGSVIISNSRIVANDQYGILINAGSDYIISNNIIGANSQEASGTYYGILVANDINNFQINGNRIGNIDELTEKQGYGIVTGGSSNNYTINSNSLCGNVNGGMSNGATGLTNSTIGNICS